MSTRCRKIKYTKGRSCRPVVKIQNPPTVASFPTAPTASSLYDRNYDYYNYGEGVEEVKDWDTPRKCPIEYLRIFIDKNRFIPQDLSNEFLCLFLSGAAYDVEEASNKLLKYFQSREEPSYLFRDRDPLSVENQNIFDSLYVVPMPETTDLGQKIILTGLIKPTIKYCQMQHAKALAMVLDLLIWEKDFGFGDLVIVLDGRGFECPQLLGNQLRNHKSLSNVLLDTIPGRLSAFYLLYPPCHVANVADNRDGIWITVVRSKQEMLTYLPADTLPLEFGGNLGHLGDIIEQWSLHMIECRTFFLNFERRMSNIHQQRLCYEKERKERGKNWVQEMKLEADEWDLKIQYYEKMKNYAPLKHPAFGTLRNVCKPKEKPVADPLKKFREKAKEEAEAAKTFEPTFLYHGYAKEIRKAKLEAEKEKLQHCWAFSPVRELHVILS